MEIWLYAILIILTVLLFALMLLFNRQKNLLEQWHAKMDKRLGALEKEEQELHKELAALKEGFSPLAQILREMREIKGHLNRASKIQDEDAPYRQAEWLLAKGADAKQIAKETGISYAEAQLLARLKGQALPSPDLDSDSLSEG
jgi:predicted RNase H-like nuclease (RuvC/YqgF family)